MVAYALPQIPASGTGLHTHISMCRVNYYTQQHDFGEEGKKLKPEKYQERIAESKRSSSVFPVSSNILRKVSPAEGRPGF